ncbi:MAG: AAA family ATPase, partial [Ureaplasma sp.]|nr:AAA family ATPase [Ureaplasma sp.]
MVFLKKFYAEGFKSFARPLTLNFNNTMIGVIGPNGSGKSNIVDGLRWAMGEQSNKTLRGKEKTNMIFVGSNDMKEADYALVELTFDNTNRVLHSDLDEVKISRKLIRKTGETIYSLNDQPCLLKDINNIFIDSGLGKGSLGIITQGSVNWFAEAKAEERRQMFESAAGIGKYIKQKEETLRNLEKATDNLSRLDQFESTLKREINELSKQVEKAKQYNEKIEQLKKYEISVSVQDYLTWTDELKELTNKVEQAKQNIINYDNEVKSSKELRDTCQSKYYEVDSKIKNLSESKDELTDKINKLTYKKTRYISNLENQLSQGTIEERKQSYLSLISLEENTVSSLKKQIETYENVVNDCESRIEAITSKLNSLKEEYNECSNDFQNKQRKYNELKTRFENSTSMDRGIRALLNAKERFPGVINTVGNLIKVPERYEMAIQTSLGKSVSNLVVQTDKVSIEALKFLKDNRLGRATFLPLNTIKPKDIRQDTLTIMTNLPGYIGVANELIKYDEKYQNAILNLLGNVIIADEIENANHISKMINAIYKIITLDGDVIYASGAISGGQKLDSSVAIFNLEEKMKIAKEEYEA